MCLCVLTRVVQNMWRSVDNLQKCRNHFFPSITWVLGSTSGCGSWCAEPSHQPKMDDCSEHLEIFSFPSFPPSLPPSFPLYPSVPSSFANFFTHPPSPLSLSSFLPLLPSSSLPYPTTCWWCHPEPCALYHRAPAPALKLYIRQQLWDFLIHLCVFSKLWLICIFLWVSPWGNSSV